MYILNIIICVRCYVKTILVCLPLFTPYLYMHVLGGSAALAALRRCDYYNTTRRRYNI